MSIFPKVAIGGRHRKVTLHTRVINGGGERIEGTIAMKVRRPDGRYDQIRRKIKVNGDTALDRYFQYSLARKPFGRYSIDTRFYVGEDYVGSETRKTDFFDYVISAGE